MKSSEAKPLDKNELESLRSLMQRWILVTYPFYGGSSEESDAFATYYDVKYDASKGHMPERDEEEIQYIKEQIIENETNLD